MSRGAGCEVGLNTLGSVIFLLSSQGFGGPPGLEASGQVEKEPAKPMLICAKAVTALQGERPDSKPAQFPACLDTQLHYLCFLPMVSYFALSYLKEHCLCLSLLKDPLFGSTLKWPWSEFSK